MAKKRKKKEPKESLFVIGDKVRVRPGVIDPDWPDVPLGGWAGKVESWSESAEEGYDGFIVEVIWNRETLKQMPPICKVRSEREGLQYEKMYLREDELMPDDGSPVVLEQPTNLVTRPLDLDDQEDRIREALGLTSRDDRVPRPNSSSLRKYASYLTQRLSVPFAGRMRDVWEPGLAADEQVLVLRLLEAVHRDYGLTCEVRRENPELTPDERNRCFAVPLTIVDVPDGPNDDLLGDYDYWFGEG